MSNPPDPIRIFDRSLVRAHRDRAAASFSNYSFLIDEIADRLADRLLDIKRDFPVALDLGARTGSFDRMRKLSGGIETLLQTDLSHAMTQQTAGFAAVADEEWLPFAEESLDLVVSNMSLHWVNDLPGALIQINRALKPDGLFLGALLGGDTLIELRDSLMAAEIELTDGAGPRVSPFADLRDGGALLQRAGFALPVVDSDRITVSYATIFELMADLRGMGETNATFERSRTPLTRRLLLQAAEVYHDRYSNSDGRLEATFHVIYLHGWAPHESQQKPLRPGSAKQRLAQVLGSTERSAGEKAG
jgi:SAM-dependent methyltransferase